MVEAMDDTLNAGRLPVLRDWARYARARRFRHPVVALAEVELELRRGRHLTSLTLARAALSNGWATGDLRYRITMTAARAAHAGSHDEEALDLYREALALSTTPEQQRDARWGELVCTAALELPEAHTLLDVLRRTVDTTAVRDQVRLADKQLLVGLRFGVIRHLAESRAATELVDRTDDPFVRCSFRTVHGWALALSAHYDEALLTTQALLHDATEHRVDLSLPYALAVHAVALAGLRRFDEAIEAVDLSLHESKRLNDVTGVLNAYAIRVRLLLQAGEVAEACATEPPPCVKGTQPSIAGEALASRALALATIARVDEARNLAEAASAQTQGVEAAALHDAVTAVCAIKVRGPDVVGTCEALLKRALDRGALDFLVTAYRANPGLLSVLLSSSSIRDEALFVVRRARDEALLASLGLIDQCDRRSRRDSLGEGAGGLCARLRRTVKRRDRSAALHRGKHSEGAYASTVRQARRPFEDCIAAQCCSARPTQCRPTRFRAPAQVRWPRDRTELGSPRVAIVLGGICEQRDKRDHGIGVELTSHRLQKPVASRRIHHRGPIGPVDVIALYASATAMIREIVGI